MTARPDFGHHESRMSVVRVRIDMHGPPGSVGLGAFGVLLEQFQALTSTLARDREIDGATWKVMDLQVGSAVAIAAIDVPDDGLSLANDLVSGVDALHEEPKIPATFGATALPRVIRMADAARDNPVRLHVIDGGRLTAVVDRTVAKNARIANRATTTSIGGFYGEIQLLDVRSGKKFGLRDEFSQRWIRCQAADEDVMSAAKHLMIEGTRVYVAGEVTENAARQPLRIRVQSIEPQPWVGESVARFVGELKRAPAARQRAADIIRSERDW